MSTLKVLGSVAALALFATASASAATLNLPAMSCSYSFNTNMGIGARGEMVRDLQKVLNMYPSTQVSMTAGAAGSPGFETTYFGPATRAAVVKFQALHPVDTLTTGFVGPLTRALLNLVCTGSGIPGGSGTNPGTGVGVSVSSTANNGGVLVAGSAQVPVLNFRMTNNTGAAVTLNSIKFIKMGILSDSNISNAYLSSGNNIVAQYTGLSNGILTFSNVGAVIPAGSSVDMSLRLDISASAPSSNLVAFQLASANDITLSSGMVTGTFPINGGNYYVSQVSNPSLASITNVSYQAVANSVDSGTMGFRAGAFTFNVVNNPVKLQSVRLTVSGSVNLSSDLANTKLRVDGQEVATGMMSGDGRVFFDLGANPKTLNTGSHQIEMYTDVLGTPNRNFKVELLRPFDVVLMDTQYNTNISFTTPTGTATTVSVRQGTANMTLASDTPTGNIPVGGSNVTLAKVTFRAAGEGLRIKWLPIQIAKTGGVDWAQNTGSVDAVIRNVQVTVDDGSQLGSTINTPSSCTYGTPVLATNSWDCSIGSPTSNINYLVPANTTRVFSIKADIQTTSGTTTSLRAGFNTPAGTWDGNNVEGQVSFQTSEIPGGLIQGSALTISTTPFMASQNASFSTPTYVAGATMARVGSFSLSASSAEPIDLTSITIQNNYQASPSLSMQNLRLMVNGTEWNYVQPTLASATSTYTFTSPSGQTRIAAGGSVTVDVHTDINTSSSAATYVGPFALVGAVGTGVNTNSNQTLKNSAGSTISTSVPVTGQNVVVAGAGSVSVTVDTSVPPAQQLVLGSTGATLGQFRFTASNNEGLRIDQLTLTATSSVDGAPATFKNLTIWDGGTMIATCNALQLASVTAGYTSLCTIPNGGLVVPQNQSKVLTVKGDVATFSESPSSHNKPYTFRIAAASDVRAYGQASSGLVTVNGTYPLVANAQTALRTKVTATLAPSGSTVNRSRSASDDVATLTLSADSAYSAEFRGVSFTFSGAAYKSGQSFATTTVSLVDAATGVVATTTTATTSLVTLNLAAAEIITQGGSKTYRVRVDSGAFFNTASVSDSFSVQIVAASDLRVREEGGSTDFGLQAKDVPITSTVSYE
jgi:hypothetical protein